MNLDYDEDHFVKLLRGIREAEYLCDVTLIAGTGQRR